MKSFFLSLVLLICSLRLFSQSYPQNWVYEEVITVDSTVRASELHERAKLFIAANFKNANSVIQLDDTNNQILIGKGTVSAYYKLLGRLWEHGFVNFTLKIQSRDGKYKYTISDFNHVAVESKQVSIGTLDKEKPGGGILTIGKKNFDNLKENLHIKIAAFIEALKQTMVGKAGTIKDNF